MASEDLDCLFSVSLKDFVAERGRIARALEEAGRATEAKAIAKTPRPTVSAWVVNQIARREPVLVRELGALTGRLQDAQGRMMRMGEGGSDYAALAADHRRLLAELREKAEEVLARSGQGQSPQLLKRVIGNLRAGAASADTRLLIESGRLSRDLEERGFGGLFEPGAAPPARRPRDAPAPATRSAEQARERRRREAAARAQERAEARELAAAVRRVGQLRSAAAAARAALEKQERARAAAREALAEADRRVDAARLAAEAVSRKLGAAAELVQRHTKDR